MRILYRFAIRHPAPTLILALTAVFAASPGLARLELRTDGYALVPEDNPTVVADRAVRDEFNTEDLIVVLIRSDGPDGVFTPETLRLIHDLTREFQEIEGIKPYNVSSLDTEHNYRVKPGTLDFRRFLEPLPETPEQARAVWQDVRKIELHLGTIVSEDGTAASIFVGVPAGLDRTDLYSEVQTLIAAHGPHKERIDVIGAVVAESLLGTHILEDLGVPDRLLGVQVAEAEKPQWRWPRSFYELRLFIAEHIGLVPIAIAIMAGVFLVCFRKLSATLLPLMEVGACLVTVFGLMGWFGVPIYLTIAVMPIILTAIGVADEIHIFARYAQERRLGGHASHRDAVRATMDEMFSPVMKTSVTTTVGFLSFAFSPLKPVQAFGIFTAVGIVFCMLWSLTAIPALLALLAPKTPAPQATADRQRAPWSERLFGRLAPVVGRARWLIAAAAVLFLVIVPFGVAEVRVQDSWIDGFAPESAFYRATQAFNDQFLGMHVLLVPVRAEHRSESGTLPQSALDTHHQIKLPPNAIDDPEDFIGHQILIRRLPGQEIPYEPPPPPGPEGRRPPPRRQPANKWQARIADVTRTDKNLIITTQRTQGLAVISLQPRPDEVFEYEIWMEPFNIPENIRRIEGLERFIEDQKHHTVGGVIGTADYVKTTNYIGRGLRDGTRVIPDETERVEWVWNQYKRIRGEERLRQVVNAEFTETLVTAFLKNANYVDVAALMGAVRDYEAEHLRPHGLSIDFAGDVAVSQTVIRAIVTTQRWSLLGSLIGILVITCILGRSIKWGVLCVLPCSMAVLFNFAVMGWTGMPLGVATSMFAGMTLGIGVDFAIHLLERYRLARKSGLEPQAAMTDAMTMTGPAIMVDALAVALGFGIMMLSQVPANARLGELLVLSILGCLVTTLLLLPALLRIVRPHRAMSVEPLPTGQT